MTRDSGSGRNGEDSCSEAECEAPQSGPAKTGHRPTSGATQEIINRLKEAAATIIATRSDTFQARNGRRVSIEGEDGEKCWIVPFDEMNELEGALSTLIDHFAEEFSRSQSERVSRLEEALKGTVREIEARIRFGGPEDEMLPEDEVKMLVDTCPAIIRARFALNQGADDGR